MLPAHPSVGLRRHQEADARKNIARFRCGALGTIVVNRMLTEGSDLPRSGGCGWRVKQSPRFSPCRWRACAARSEGRNEDIGVQSGEDAHSQIGINQGGVIHAVWCRNAAIFQRHYQDPLYHRSRTAVCGVAGKRGCK